jgi:PIN domain nuclease of toxin-antitoxin system
MDASAVLALLNGESGADRVAMRLAGSVISTVNLAEVHSKLADYGMSDGEIGEVTDALGLEPVPFDAGMAQRAGRLRPLTRALGLSLGDRACLALAVAVQLPVLTAEQAWTCLDLGVRVETIR